ncbi:MAG: glucosidase, partial [Candidatus Omnitrophica bacterium]|nr:glucosidase [Candidatus Omnitrophota bacterium]
ASLKNPLGKEFTETFMGRIQEADEFYKRITPFELSEEERNIQRQAFAGMLWSKQFYNYVVEDWLKGDKFPPPKERYSGRNHEWKHLYNDDILSMPDKWEYPWFAAWDAAFHMIPFTMIDPEFAKHQMELYTREWYMHPNGQIPAYEWNFSDVNPPVHAWAALRVFKIEKKMHGNADYDFLERTFQKLLLNFTWWVNRKDADGRNIFEGGFLGMDNIGVFDRSSELPIGGHLHQADGTSWMAMYCLNMLAIALELTKKNMVYEDIASKFFEHFIYIARAMNNMGDESVNLWNEKEGFYSDVAHTHEGLIPFKIFSMVGLIPLFAIEVLSSDTIERLPGFKKRMEWFINNRPDLCNLISCPRTAKKEGRRVLSLVSPKKLERILRRLLDENEFLSEFGIRTVSKRHKDNPYIFKTNGSEYSVKYAPGESDVHLFGGNSNWRGPVWFPVTYLLIESLQKFHYYLGDEFKVEAPLGSGNKMSLWEVSQFISKRLINLFEKNKDNVRPVYGDLDIFKNDPYWSEYILFFEYFHGDSGRGVGASHQTGWTGLVAKLIQQYAEYKTVEREGIHAILS